MEPKLLCPIWRALRSIWIFSGLATAGTRSRRPRTGGRFRRCRSTGPSRSEWARPPSRPSSSMSTLGEPKSRSSTTERRRSRRTRSNEAEVGLNLIDACAIAQGQFAAVELAGREVVVVLVVRQAAPEEVLALLELLPRAPRAALGGRLRSRWPVLKVDGVEMEESLVRRVRVGRMGGRDERNGGKGEPPLRRADRPRHARSCNQQAPTPHTTRYAPRSSRFTHPLPRTESAVIYDKEGFGRTRLHAQRTRQRKQ